MFIQLAIDLVSRWTDLCELPLSKKKIRLLLIGHKNQTLMSTYRNNDEPLNRVNEARGSGFNITSDLCFSQHCRDLVKKANYRIYNLFKVLNSQLHGVYIRAYKTSVTDRSKDYSV